MVVCFLCLLLATLPLLLMCVLCFYCRVTRTSFLRIFLKLWIKINRHLNQTYFKWYEFDVNVATCTYASNECSDYEWYQRTYLNFNIVDSQSKFHEYLWVATKRFTADLLYGPPGPIIDKFMLKVIIVWKCNNFAIFMTSTALIAKVGRRQKWKWKQKKNNKNTPFKFVATMLQNVILFCLAHSC